MDLQLHAASCSVICLRRMKAKQQGNHNSQGRGKILGPYTGLKYRPRPGPARKYDLRPRPGPGPQQLCRPGPGPARKLNYEAGARPGPQQLCPGPARPATQFHIWGPARARGPRAGPLARPHRPKKQQYYYCVHIPMWLLSCYVHNHMYFQCLGEV